MVTSRQKISSLTFRSSSLMVCLAKMPSGNKSDLVPRFCGRSGRSFGCSWAVGCRSARWMHGKAHGAGPTGALLPWVIHNSLENESIRRFMRPSRSDDANRRVSASKRSWRSPAFDALRLCPPASLYPSRDPFDHRGNSGRTRSSGASDGAR